MKEKNLNICVIYLNNSTVINSTYYQVSYVLNEDIVSERNLFAFLWPLPEIADHLAQSFTGKGILCTDVCSSCLIQEFSISSVYVSVLIFQFGTRNNKRCIAIYFKCEAKFCMPDRILLWEIILTSL